MDKNAASGTDFLNDCGHVTIDDVLKVDWYSAQVEFRKLFIAHKIREHKANMSAVADDMGMDRGSLYRMMKSLKTNTYKTKRAIHVRRNKRGLITMPETTADIL